MSSSAWSPESPLPQIVAFADGEVNPRQAESLDPCGLASGPVARKPDQDSGKPESLDLPTGVEAGSQCKQRPRCWVKPCFCSRPSGKGFLPVRRGVESSARPGRQ